jgi:hypothetical protein
MAKRLELGALINTEETPPQGEVQQRGAGSLASKRKTSSKTKASATERPAEEIRVSAGPSKRLSLTLDAETYRQLRLLAVETDKTHQAILEEAARAYLRNHARA